MALKKTLGASRISQSIEGKSSTSLKKTPRPHEAATVRPCTSRTAFWDITARANIVPLTLQQEDAMKRTFTSLAAWGPAAGSAPGVPNTNQEGTSAGRTSLSSETTLRGLSTLLDAYPAGPHYAGPPDQGEPSSVTADMTEAHPMQGEGVRCSSPFQYPFAKDVFFCPICYLVREYQFLGGFSRPLKKLHNKRITFRCTLCGLPF